MIFVLDQNNVPLMPCSEKRARQLMERGQAKRYYQKGIFGIKLTKEPSARNYQDVVLGIDPGSKREAYTVMTKNSVVINITTDTKTWVKGNVETRRNLRTSRRNRKTPYRQSRNNRASLRKSDKIAPSTKSRWQTKFNMIKFLCSIFPIKIVNIEDIKAKTKEGKSKWNTSFSPLEVGKNWFYGEVETFGLKLLKTEGFTTK